MIDPEMRKKLGKAWLWLAVILVSAGIWILAFYWVSQTPSELSFEIWVGADSYIIDGDLRQSLEDICAEHGMKEISVRTYNPDDSLYAQSFALEARSVDLFVLNKTEAEAIAETGLFRELGDGYIGESCLVYGDGIIGVRFMDDYYALINGMSKKSDDLLFAALDKIVEYGKEI